MTDAATSPGVDGAWFPLVLAFAACLLASCFFSFSETCLTWLSESRVHSLMS